MCEKLDCQFEWPDTMPNQEISRRAFIDSFEAATQRESNEHMQESDSHQSTSPSDSPTQVAPVHPLVGHTSLRPAAILVGPSSTLFTVDMLDRIDFDPFGHSDDTLVEGIGCIFLYTGLLDTLHIPPIMLQTFLLEVKNHYRPNRFHNFAHAFSVTHMTYIMLRQGGLITTTTNGPAGWSTHNATTQATNTNTNTPTTTTTSTNGGVQPIFTPIHIFSLLIAALCHDIDRQTHRQDVTAHIL